MPVCPSCFAYYVRSPCPYCADKGHPRISESQFESLKPSSEVATEEKAIRRQVTDLQGKVELLQTENQRQKEEITEKNRVIAGLESELRSVQDDRDFLLSKIAELEGKDKEVIAPETVQDTND
ncbi:MAG: hypothetical protein ACE5R6_11580 [Candidatus Heimdallarchaeota archaeon]